MLEFTFSTTEKEAKEASEIIRRKMKHQVFLTENGNSKIVSVREINFILKIFLFFCIPYFAIRNYLSKRANSQRFVYPIETSLIFDEKGILVKSTTVNGWIFWKEVLKIVDTKSYILFLGAKMTVHLPKHVIESTKVHRELFKLIEKNTTGTIEAEELDTNRNVTN